jgi:ketosteroid isomerase-like protein
MTDIKKWPTISGEKVDILKQVFLAGESMNIDNFVNFFSDDALYRFGNSPIVFGHEGIKQSSIDFLQKVEGIHHHINDIWKIKENEIVVELEVTYIRYDGKVFTLPCCDIIRFQDNKVQEMLIFMDISPVYQTPESASITDGKNQQMPALIN